MRLGKESPSFWYASRDEMSRSSTNLGVATTQFSTD
jgi:hypothetical protein